MSRIYAMQLLKTNIYKDDLTVKKKNSIIPLPPPIYSTKKIFLEDPTVN